MNAKRLNLLILGLLVIFFAMTAVLSSLTAPCAASASPRPEQLAEAVLHQDEIILDGTVEISNKGTLLYTSDDEYVVVLEGVADLARSGQHIMVVGYPYQKDGDYYLNVTGYTYLSRNGDSLIE